MNNTLAPINLITMPCVEREAYARGIEAAANLLSVAECGDVLDIVCKLRLLAARARAL